MIVYLLFCCWGQALWHEGTPQKQASSLLDLQVEGFTLERILLVKRVLLKATCRITALGSNSQVWKEVPELLFLRSSSKTTFGWLLVAQQPAQLSYDTVAKLTGRGIKRGQLYNIHGQPDRKSVSPRLGNRGLTPTLHAYYNTPV